MRDKILSNYHNHLERISNSIDPIIFKLQDSRRKHRIKNPYLFMLLLPLKDIKQLSQAFKNTANINVMIYPIIASIFSTLIVFAEVTTFLKIATPIAIFTIYILLLFIFHYSRRMLSFEDKYFHLDFYKARREQEYKMLSYAIENDVSFKGLYDFVNTILGHEDDVSRGIQLVQEENRTQQALLKEEHKKELEKLKQGSKDAIKKLRDTILTLSDSSKSNSKIIVFFLELLTEINIILFRIVNGNFGQSDLSFLSGITVYAKHEKGSLLKIIDEGTTGISPDVLYLNDKTKEHWAVIKSFETESKTPLLNNPRDNYSIISYYMNMGKVNDKVWILNFHVSKNINKRAWYFLQEDDIMKGNKEIYRLFHGLCLILDKQILQKGVGTHDNGREGKII